MLLRLHTSGKISAAALLFVAASVWAQKPDTPPTPATMPASQAGCAFRYDGLHSVRFCGFSLHAKR